MCLHHYQYYSHSRCMCFFFFAVNVFNCLYCISLTLTCAGSLCLCGIIIFYAIFIQFGKDQLRDAPTRYSVLFLCCSNNDTESNEYFI